MGSSGSRFPTSTPPLGTQKGLKMAKNRPKFSKISENFDFFSMCWAKYRCIIPDIGPYACPELFRTWGGAPRALYPPLGTQKGLKIAKNRPKFMKFSDFFLKWSIFGHFEPLLGTQGGVERTGGTPPSPKQLVTRLRTDIRDDTSIFCPTH